MQVLLMTVVFGIWGCQDLNTWDAESGNQQNPPPAVDPSYAACAHPTMGKEGSTYYFISSNATLDGITPGTGLLVRTSENMVNMAMSEENAYILSNVVADWAEARLVALDGTIDKANVKIGEPCVRKFGDTWYLFYSVSAGTKASVIGYATASSLAAGEWTDKGEILSSEPADGFKAISPSVCASPDGSKWYMAFGQSAEGVFVVELNAETVKPAGAPVLIASRADAAVNGDPSLLYYGGYYHLIWTIYHDGGNIPLICHAVSKDAQGAYADFSGRTAVGIPTFWNITRVMTNFQHAGGTIWLGVGGADVQQVDGRYLMVHHAVESGSTSPQLHIREMNWVEDARRAHGADVPVPAISPQRFAGTLTGDITAEDLVGDWYYGTLWAHVSFSGITDPMTFKADGSYDGGSWNFDAATQTLQLTSTEWGGEKIYIRLSKAYNWDNEKSVTIVGAGLNDTFGDFPGAWMMKQGVSTEEPVDEGREGVFNPTMAKLGSLFYIVSGNAKSDQFAYEKGLCVRTSDDLVFFDEQGYVLSDVVDGWAKTKLLELNPDIDASKLVVDDPHLVQVGNEWRLYYSVNTNPGVGEAVASVIGYAVASSPAGPWTDKGMVLSSVATDETTAAAPSVCVDQTGRTYMAYGRFRGPLKVVELGIDGLPVGLPVSVAWVAWDGNLYASPEMVYLAAENQFAIVAVAGGGEASIACVYAQNPFGPYISRAGMNVTEGILSESFVFGAYNLVPGDNSQIVSRLSGWGLYNDNGQWYVVHTAKQGQAPTAAAAPQLHVRSMVWRSIAGYSCPLMCAQRFDPDAQAKALTRDDLVGTYRFASFWWVWGDNFTNVDLPMSFRADGVFIFDGIENGIWDYDAASGMLHFQNNAWGGEHIYLHMSNAYDYENGGGTAIVGTGANATFFMKMGTILKRTGDYVAQ